MSKLKFKEAELNTPYKNIKEILTKHTEASKDEILASSFDLTLYQNLRQHTLKEEDMDVMLLLNDTFDTILDMSWDWKVCDYNNRQCEELEEVLHRSIEQLVEEKEDARNI